MEARSFFFTSLPPAANCATAPGLGRLGSLSACVGVNLGIEYHDVDVLAACKYMVNTAESDIVCPSVTTEDPLGLLSQGSPCSCRISLRLLASACFQSSYQLIGSCAVGSTYSVGIQPCLSCCLYICRSLSLATRASTFAFSPPLIAF